MAQYSIEALASRTGSTVRNVRAYQDRGLLAPPGRKGRHAVYDDMHLARMRLILELLKRGYSLSSIKDLLDAQQRGERANGVLGLVNEVTGPWSDEEPTVMTSDELVRMYRLPNATKNDVGVELGVLEKVDGGYRVLSPRLLMVGAQLRQAGVPLMDVISHLKMLRQAMEAVAEQFVRLGARYVPGPRSKRLPEAADIVRRLRPLA